MSSILTIDHPFVCVGPNSFTYTALLAGQYKVRVQITENPPSSVVLTVTQNGGNVYTGPVITPTQSAQQMTIPLQCAATDAIVVALTSAAPLDNQLNTVKWTTYIQRGF